MYTATPQRSFFRTATFSIIATLLFSLISSLFHIAQAAPTNGRNVNVVSVEQGTFRQVGSRQWVEQNKQGQRVFSFTETHRDDWSVYLHDASRNVRL